MRTPSAPVKPALLIWARKSIRLDREQAAKKIGVKVAQLTAWEEGESAPTLAQLRNAANAYKRPLSVFFLPEPPADFLALRDFRRVHGATAREWSPTLALTVRRAIEQREVVAELTPLLDAPRAPRPTVQAALTEPAEMAAQARDLLGITLEQQFAWTDRYQALNAWLAAIDDVGVLVMQAKRIDTDEMRGLSIDDPEIPVVVLNGADSARGRIFTLMHEFAHVLSRSAGVCDLHDEDKTERLCNEVAAAILMPEGAFLGDPTVAGGPARGGWSDNQIRAIADHFTVSRESVVRRMVSFDLASWAFYRAKRRQYQAAYAKWKAETEAQVPYPRLQVRDLGRPYVRLVFEAYHAGALSTSDIADYLGVQLKHLPKLEDEAFRVATGA
jgi:Zn-dependent peptidase ImmA (M78 family)/transcriptional regulator with XRE-family HTH domain